MKPPLSPRRGEKSPSIGEGSTLDIDICVMLKQQGLAFKMKNTFTIIHTAGVPINLFCIIRSTVGLLKPLLVAKK